MGKGISIRSERRSERRGDCVCAASYLSLVGKHTLLYKMSPHFVLHIRLFSGCLLLFFLETTSFWNRCCSRTLNAAFWFCFFTTDPYTVTSCSDPTFDLTLVKVYKRNNLKCIRWGNSISIILSVPLDLSMEFDAINHQILIER